MNEWERNGINPTPLTTRIAKPIYFRRYLPPPLYKDEFWIPSQIPCVSSCRTKPTCDMNSHMRDSLCWRSCSRFPTPASIATSAVGDAVAGQGDTFRKDFGKDLNFRCAKRVIPPLMAMVAAIKINMKERRHFPLISSCFFLFVAWLKLVCPISSPSACRQAVIWRRHSPKRPSCITWSLAGIHRVSSAFRMRKDGVSCCSSISLLIWSRKLFSRVRMN